ncbi:MAG: hypothetical protein WAX69_23720 [Victivallales bacterium]
MNPLRMPGSVADLFRGAYLSLLLQEITGHELIQFTEAEANAINYGPAVQPVKEESDPYTQKLRAAVFKAETIGREYVKAHPLKIHPLN